MAELTHEVVSLEVDPQEAYERGKTDINFFASLCMPDIFVYALPSFYIAVWQLLAQRKPEDVGRLLRFALGLPRGHAKTTFIKILIAWLIVYDHYRFVLMVCANEGLAENLLADLDDILGSPNIEAIYGAWKSNLITDRSDLKKAWYHGRAVILAAKGAGSSLRGLNIRNDRPDLIFCDDAQTRENDESPTERAKLLRWMTATLFKVLKPRGDRLIIYVGNMYSEECLLKQFADHQQWLSLITGAILYTGEPLWPELFSLEELRESFLHDEALGQADLWFAEIMNDPKDSANSLLPQTLPDAPDNEELIANLDGAYITIDPAGFRKASDDNQIVVHGVADGKGHVIASDRGIIKPDELIRKAIQLALKYRVTLIGVEAVAYQQTLCFWLEFFLKELRITGITVVELAPHGRTKESRIRLFIQELYAGNYTIACPATRADFVWQALAYKVGKKDNKDDLLDGCAYGLDIRNEYWHLIGLRAQIDAAYESAQVVLDNTPF